MRMLSRSVIWCVAITACSTDPTTPVSPPNELGAALDMTAAATWNQIYLESDPNYVATYPVAVNNRYQILGYSVDASGKQHQFIQRLGQQRRYLTPGLDARAINDFGVLAGSSGGVPAYWDSEQRVSFIPGVVSGSADDITETGWIIGRGTLADGRNRSFIWRPGWAQIRVLGEQYPSSVTTSAVSVNNAGYAAGEVGGRGGVWAPTGEFEPIPLPDSVFAVEPSEINDAGQVVGRANVNHPFGPSGFSWTRGRAMTVMVPNHFLLQHYVTDIDRHGRVYGTLRADFVFYYVVVWRAGVLLPAISSGTYTRLTDVNDCGVAVGWSQFPFGNQPVVPLMWLTEC